MSETWRCSKDGNNRHIFRFALVCAVHLVGGGIPCTAVGGDGGVVMDALVKAYLRHKSPANDEQCESDKDIVVRYYWGEG